MNTRQKRIIWGAIISVSVIAGICWFFAHRMLVQNQKQMDLLYENAYRDKANENWSHLINTMSKIEIETNGGSIDFYAFSKYIELVIVDFEKSIPDCKTITPPEKYKVFHTSIVNLADKTLEAIKSIRDYGASGTEINRQKLNTAVSVLHETQSSTFNSWPADTGKQLLQPKNDIFSSVAKNFNESRRARRVTVSSSESSTISIPVFTDPVRAAYFSRLRDLIRQYKGLRNQLGGGITDRIHKVGFQPGDQNVLTSAYNSRDAIVKEIETTPLPNGCLDLYQVAHDAVVNGRDAVQYLQYGNWDKFHEMSNNGIAKRAYRTFGIGE